MFSESQFQALEDFYLSTNGDDWSWSDYDVRWNFTDPTANPCTENWKGIVCYGMTEVSILSLSSFGLQGTLPDSFGDLSSLFQLQLDHNALSLSLPASVTNLTLLFELDLSANQLTGPIHSFVSALSPSIFYLDLSSNRFTGTLPSAIGNFSQVFYLAFSDNFLDGTLTDIDFAALHSVQVILLSHNNFHGHMSSLASLPMLQDLELGFNAFSGSLDAWVMSNSSSIQTFAIYDNFFSGPMVNRAWKRLDVYEIDTNLFTGSIRCVITASLRLNYFDVAYNAFSSSLPACFQSLDKLAVFSVQGNALTGSLPKELFDIPYLTAMYLDDNRFVGVIPESIVNCSALFGFTASYNQFSGPLPHGLAELTFLEELLLEGNRFTGRVGQLFDVGFRMLVAVDLSANEFTGPLPTTFFNENKQISSFAVAGNCFTGSLPLQICNATQLRALQLDGIGTSNSCREYIFPSSLREYLDAFLLRDVISGGIPQCYWSLPHLSILHLSGNGLTGSLSDSLSLAPSLRYVSISHNALVGTIPDYFLNNDWISLDVSYNKLYGNLQGFKNTAFLNPNASLSLDINRLSGHIPSVLVDATSISLLNGNMFSCDMARSQLPNHDSQSKIYSCGSDDVNDSIYLWIAALCIPLLVWFLIDRKIIRHQRMDSFSLSDHSLSVDSDALMLRETISSQSNMPTIPMTARKTLSMDSTAISTQSSSKISQRSISSSEFGQSSEPETHSESDWMLIAPLFQKHSIFVWQDIFHRFKYKRISDEDTTSRQTTFLTKQMLFEQRMQLENDLETNNFHYTYSHVYLFHKTMTDVRWKALIVTVFILCILLPIYGVLSTFQGTYEYQYAWLISAAFVSGTLAAAVLVSALISFLAFVSVLFQQLVHKLNVLRTALFTTRANGAQLRHMSSNLVSDRVFSRAEQDGDIVDLDVDVMSDIDEGEDNEYQNNEEGDGVDDAQGNDSDNRLESTACDSVPTKSSMALTKSTITDQRESGWRVFSRSSVGTSFWRSSTQPGHSRETATAKDLSSSNNDNPNKTDSASKPNQSSFHLPTMWPLIVSWSIASLINLMVMLSLDSAYVFIVLHYSSGIVYAAQVGLAVAKLLWNENVVFQLVYFSKKLFLGMASSRSSKSVSSQELPGVRLSIHDVTALSIISIVNKIVIPCIAIALVNSNCFYNALVAAPAVSAQFIYCNENIQATGCVNLLSGAKDGSTYHPPFTYSYQCSSFFLADYTPVFIYMFAFSSLFVPFVLFCMQNLHDSLADYILFSEFERICKPTNERASSAVTNNRARVMYKFLCDWLPQTWQCPHAISQSQRDNKSRLIMIVNNKQRITIRINNSFAVLVSFAALFPPLAVICLVSILVLTYFEERNTSRVLRHANTYEKRWLVERIERESVGITHCYKYTTLLMVVLASWFFAFLAFDTLGDVHGWQEGLVVAAVVASIPLVLWLVWLVYQYLTHSTAIPSPIAVEMIAWRMKSTDSRNEPNEVINPIRA